MQKKFHRQILQFILHKKRAHRNTCHHCKAKIKQNKKSTIYKRRKFVNIIFGRSINHFNLYYGKNSIKYYSTAFGKSRCVQVKINEN